jgi:hypothetical protein
LKGLIVLVLSVLLFVASLFFGGLCRLISCAPCVGFDVFNPVCQAGWVACNATIPACYGWMAMLGGLVQIAAVIGFILGFVIMFVEAMK